jgi:hypothetical protein
MTTDTTIRIINQGSHHVINFTVTNVNLSTATAIRFVIAASAASDALVDKTVGSGITVGSSTTCTIAIAPSDTASLSGTFRTELRVTNASNQTDLVYAGSMQILANVTG